MKRFKRSLAGLLVLVMVLGQLPVLAGAEGLCEHHTAHEDCGYVEGEAPCTFVCEECTQVPVEPEAPALSAPETDTTELDRVQGMIDALPDAMTAETQAELLAYKETLDAAISALGAEQIALLDLSKYNAVYNAPMEADTYGVWEYYTNPDGDGGYYAVITGYNGSGGRVTIPSTINGAKVRHASFYGTSASITSITCGSYLESVPDVYGAGDSLTTVNLGAATIEEIDTNAFYGCEKLTSFTWPKGVKVIGDGAFAATGLTSISIPSTVTRIGGPAAGSNYTSGTGVFEDCEKLTSVSFSGTGLTEIRASTFEDCTALKSIKIPGGVTSIGDYAFSGCTALTSVNWGTSSVTRIGKHAFTDCTALTELTLPDGVTSLGDYCFADSGITALHLPDSLLSVTGAPFQWASKLQELTVNSTNYSYKSVDGVLFNKAGTRLVCYPAGKPSVSRYQIPDGVTTIGREAFGGRWSSQNIYCVYGNISNLCFPDTVTRVEENGAAYYSGNFYFCGDKPATTDIFDLGNNQGVTHYYTPGRTGWTEGTYVKPWPDLDHCTTRTQTVIDATCTTAGGYQYVCDICGYTCCDGKGTPALDHDWSEWEVLKDPICTIDGLRQRFCLRDGCDAMEEEVTPALGHAWTTLLCTEEATCNECSEVRPAGEHNWEEASCTEPKHCTKCPLTEGEALGHEIVIDARVEPTCTAAGKTEGKHCSRCKEVLVAQTTLAATGHTEVIDPAVPATQRLTGLTEGKHCSACGLVLVAQKKTAATGSHTKHAVCQERCDHEEPHEIVTFNQWYGSFKSGNYYMTSDRTISYNLTITGDAHLCLNGHTLTIADGYCLKVEYGGSLTICDCAGGGQIIRGTLAGNGDGSMILNRGTMLIGGGTIGADGHGVDLYNTGDLTIYGGTFGIEISNYYDDWSSSTTRYGKTVIYDATVCTQLYTDDDAIVNDKGCSLTIYGGDFSATGNALWNKGTANVLGGTFRTLEDGDTLNRESTIENTGRLELRNATVSSPDGNALSNNGYYTSSVNGTYVWGNVSIYEGTTLTSESTIWPTVSNSCYLNVYGGSISGYIGIENDSSFSGTTKNGGDVYIGGGTITGTKCAILNSGNTSTSYQNGVATGYKFSRGMLEINYAPNIGKIILEYPSSLVMDNSLSAKLDVELDMDYIALGDTISTGNTNKMGNINLLNEGYILLYDYYKDIYLDSSHIGATASDPLYWKYDAQGKVTIYGSGRMKNFGSSYDQPWKKEKTLVDVTEVVMEPGITYIGGYAFAFLYKVTSITIPEGVTAVGDRVLAGNNLETVYLPATLTTIGRYFFATNSNSVPPKEVYYNGCEHQWANVTVDSTQPVPVEPICLPNANADDNDCTTAFVCSVCALEVVPARQAHTGGTATCESLAQCEVCGKEYGELGHEAVTDAAVAPTCTETGLEEGSHCGLCGAVLVEQVVIPVLGHAYEATVTDPTCTEDGFTTHTCANCGDSYQDTVVPALGHFALQPGKELVDSCTMQNDATYPFTLSGGWYASSNKGHDTKSVFQLKATYDCTLVLAYKVSSEKNYDKLQVLLNGTTKATISGVVSERTITLELKAGDIAAVQYKKDVSASQNADTGYFRIVSCTQTELDTLERVPAEEVQPTCTEGVVCDTCGETVKAALGHTDGDRDHLCDNNCGEVMGEHKDSPDDDDHLCDHCQGEEILEKCHDGDDADYNCDICGAELPSTGDVDLDGGVDSDDLTLLARHVGGIELLTDPRALANADTNADGLVNSDDLTKHARFVGGIITDWTQE